MSMAVGWRKGVIFPVVAAALVSLLVVMGWFAMRADGPRMTQGASFIGPVYSSVEELSAASDAVVVGTVKGVVAREVDYGTASLIERQFIQGFPWVFYEVDVTETLQGETGDTVIVAVLDVERMSFGESVTALRTGEQVLLFLRTEDSPGITVYDNYYITIGFDNGVFDRLAGGLVRPRMPEAFVSPATVGSVEALTYSLSEVRGKIQAKQ